MAGFMEAFSSSAGNSLGSTLVQALIPTSQTQITNTSGTTRSTQKRELSQEAINKLIYDAMSGDKGVAALATGENLSGGYGSSTKALLTQDFMVKLIGELAAVTAPVTTEGETQSTQSSKSKKKVSVICTELHRQGLLETELYEHHTAQLHFHMLPAETLTGYYSWAVPLTKYLSSSPKLSAALAPIARARYRMVISGEWNFFGWLTLVPGQWICQKLGMILMRKSHGNEAA